MAVYSQMLTTAAEENGRLLPWGLAGEGLTGVGRRPGVRNNLLVGIIRAFM